MIGGGEIVALVPMHRLLDELGFSVNMRRKRCQCVLHRGSNPTSFAWTEEGFWHCHSCGRGGDKISLVRERLGYGYRETLSFLASLAGIELPRFDSAAFQREVSLRRRRERRLTQAARTLAVLQSAVLFRCRDELQGLERLRRNAGKRLAELNRGARERFRGEHEIAWEALRFVADHEASAAAAYYIAAFGSQVDQASFALRPAERERMIQSTLERGFVEDESEHRVEVLF